MILVVEDEVLIRMHLELILDEAGFEVVAVSTSRDAEAKLAADAGRFQALVTDIQLDPGGDGFELARIARTHVPTIPVIYMSGASSAEWSAKGVPRSVMLSKPFADAQLVTAIAQLLNAMDPDPAG